MAVRKGIRTLPRLCSTVAYYTNDTVDDLETGKTITGVWHLARGDDICHDGEAEVLEGPLTPPM
ncbi:hypothetical protein CF204P1_19370 [Citrobacter freundii]|nr:hypothetical protein [Citrobacter freundii]BDT23214.1 hypothetical protein CF204P1_19370 [Citrobacter freundii]